MKNVIPISEIFGPTIAGEGGHAGLPTHFIRVAGCDFRCQWCDSAHAVDPKIWTKLAKTFTAEEIAREISKLPKGPEWVQISGGNPAGYKQLGTIVDLLHDMNYKVNVETQGSIFRNWLTSVDTLTVSPKPPSSGMCQTPQHVRIFTDQFEPDFLTSKLIIKVVIFDKEDLNYARTIRQAFPNVRFFLSVGNKLAGTLVPFPESSLDTPQSLAERYRWACECVASDPAFRAARVLPQLHQLAWGNERGR